MSADIPTEKNLADLADAIASLRDVTDRIIASGQVGQVTDEQVAEPLYAAARLFSERRDRTGQSNWPIGEDALNATETVVLVTALLEAADVNLFDMAIWYRRAE